MNSACALRDAAADRSDCRAGLESCRLPEDVWRATWQSGLARAAFLVSGLLLHRRAALSSLGRRRILFGCFLLVLFWLDFVTHMPTQNPSVRSLRFMRPGWARAQLKLRPATQARRIPRHAGARRAGGSQDYIRCPIWRRPICGTGWRSRANCNLLDEVPQIDGFFSLTPREVNRATALPYAQPNRDFPALAGFHGRVANNRPGQNV